MYYNLQKEMQARNVTTEDIAKLLKLTKEETETTLNTHSDTAGEGLTVDQAVNIRNTFFADCSLEYLYSLEHDDIVVYDLPKVCSILNIARQTAMRYIKNGILPCRKVGGRWLISKSELEAFIKGK